MTDEVDPIAVHSKETGHALKAICLDCGKEWGEDGKIVTTSWPSWGKSITTNAPAIDHTYREVIV